MKPKKSLGQNFLIDEKILNQIVKNGNIKKNDIVLEIGPGTGKLTEKIVKRKPQKFIVVEKDKLLSDQLKIKFGESVEIINEDILKCYDKFKFDRPIKVFGNLPYNISTKILTSMIKLENLDKLFSNFIFVFQKEVADRIVAKYNTKEYGRLSILSTWKMEKLKIFDIPPRSFYPVPKVWSSLIKFVPKKNVVILKKPKNLEHVTNIFFNQRRKMIKKPLKILFKNYKKVSEDLSLNLNLRPQNLSNITYYKICSYYERLLK